MCNDMTGHASTTKNIPTSIWTCSSLSIARPFHCTTAIAATITTSKVTTRHTCRLYKYYHLNDATWTQCKTNEWMLHKINVNRQLFLPHNTSSPSLAVYVVYRSRNRKQLARKCYELSGKDIIQGYVSGRRPLREQRRWNEDITNRPS